MILRKSKGSTKKQRALELSWNAILAKYPQKNIKPKELEVPGFFRRETPYIRSVDTGFLSTSKTEPKMYTGDKMIGIGTLHKSNAIPIFNTDDAIAISQMRRS